MMNLPMKLAGQIRVAFFLLLLGLAISLKLSPQLFARLSVSEEPEYSGDSELYTIVPDSIYDGDTFRVSNGSEELKIRLCGVDSPEKDQALGIEARDHLRSLISAGDGRVILVKTDTDQYGRTIAEAFIPTGNGDEEIHLNSQMVVDGMAYVYPQYVDTCPDAAPMKIAERAAKDNNRGVWADSMSQKPWDYRRRS